jgi:diacylglycerol O-acyltransferase / wax synthase
MVAAYNDSLHGHQFGESTMICRPTTKSLPVLDAGWLWLESDANLMHGSILAIFQRPPHAPPNYVFELTQRMRRATTARAPFNLRLCRKGIGRIWPRWEQVGTIDTDYHVRHSALPWPGTDRELDRLVSHLHSAPLDKAHPLWTFDIIDGLDDRFAVLGKMHHALADGVAAMRMFRQWLSTDPDESDTAPMWTKPTPSPSPRPTGPAPIATKLVRQATMLPGTVAALGLAATGADARPWHAPRTVLNTPITAHRRIVTHSGSLSRHRALADAIDGTINDAVLAVCTGALRRYLLDIGNLPNAPLTTNIPVSTRGADSTRQAGNAITWAMLPLPTNQCDPRARVDAILSASKRAKRRLDAIHPLAVNTYTLAVTTPILTEQVLRLGGRTRPYFNLPISNVPGPPTPLYLDRAPLRDIHASTVIYHGQALNIVCVSYTDKLEFTFTACSSALPHLERLAQHLREELDTLESVYTHAAP